MDKIKVVVDSTSCLDIFEKQYDLDVLRLFVNFNNVEYLDGIDLTPDAFYELLKNEKKHLPSTSQPTIGDTINLYERYADEGYTDIIVLTISSKLSGTYSGSVKAATMIEKNINVHVIDTKLAATPIYELGVIASKMVQEGKSALEIVAHIEKVKSEFNIILSVGDLTLLTKNGRLSGASGFMGSLLKIKPLLEVTKEGTIETIKKIRTMNKSMDHLVDEFIKRTNGKAENVSILHSDYIEGYEYVKNLLVEYDEKYKDVKPYLLTPVIGSHVGIGTIGIVFRVKK